MKNFKDIIKLLFSIKILVLIIILVLLLVILLPASYYFITIDDGTWDDDERGNPSSYTQNVQMPVSSNESEGLTVDKDAIIKEGLTNLNYTEEEIENLTDEEIIEKLGINEKLKKFPKVTSLDELTQAEILWCLNDVYSKYLDTPEELEKLLNAEIITQYPKTGSEDSKLDGIIEFERHKTDGTSTILTYVDYETFNSYVENENEEVLDYFTIDEQGNALIAISNTITEELTSNDGDIDISEYTQNLDESDIQEDGSYKKTNTAIISKKINYRNCVQKYTMPFQYLWALLVIGEDKDFVLELADLVEDSEITISIYDSITKSETVNTYKYKKETRTDKYAKISVEDDYDVTGYATERYWLSSDSPEPDRWYYTSTYQATYTTDETEYEVKDTINSEINSPIVDLTKANVWIVDYSKEYEYQNEDTATTETNSNELEDTEYVFNNSNDSISDSSLLNDGDAVSFANSIKEFIESYFNEATNSSTNSSSSNSTNNTSETTVEANVTVSYVRLKNYDHKKDRTLDQTLTSTTQEYIAQTPVNNPKVEKDSEEDNFVTILCKGKHKKTRKFLTDGTRSWLFEILEKNSDTQNMVDLTKYLFYKVTGNSYGIKEYDFSEFEINDFSSAGGSLSVTTPTLSRESFIAAMNDYAGKNSNFDSNFLPYAADIYDWSVASGINPELVVITAKTEGNFRESGGTYNYWGIGVYNGSSSGSSFSSLKAGIEGYASVILGYQTGEHAATIKQRAVERQAAGVDPLGYGEPDTLSGVQSLYSNLGKHGEAYSSSGLGGYYYMDPAIAGVTKIYATHEEFLSKCKNGGAEHASGTKVTVWENGQYTAWQVEKKLEVWNDIFGAYGSLSVGNEAIIETAKSKIGCPYVWRG